MTKNSKLKLLDTKGKTKALSFRISENIYKKLEKRAQEMNEPVSALARRLMLKGLEVEISFELSPGDLYKYEPIIDSSSDTFVLVVDDTANKKEIDERVNKLFKGVQAKEIT